MIKGMSIETASKYVLVMDQIEEIVDRIHCLAYMMSLFCKIEEGIVDIKPFCVGYLGKMIATDVLLITDYLDNEFVSIVEVKQELEGKECPRP